MEVRKIHPKLYHISLWRVISMTVPFLGSSEGVQPLLETGQWVWLRRRSEHKLLGSISWALLWRRDTALSKAPAPFPPALPGGPHTHPQVLYRFVWEKQGVWSGLSFDFLESSMFSFHLLSYSVLPGDTNCNASTVESWCLRWSHFPPSTSMQNSVQNGNSTMTKDFYESGLLPAKLLHSVKFINSPRKLYETRLD